MGRMLKGALTVGVAIALATVFGGWWALPIVAFAAGIGAPRGTRQAAIIGACGGFAWLGLIAVQAAGGVPIGLAATKVGALFRLPAPLFLLLVPLFAFAVGWSCAAVGEELGGLLRRGKAPARA